MQCFAFWQSSYNNIGCHKLSCLSKNLWLFATSLKLEILAIQSKDYSLHVTKILILFETPLLEMKFHPVTKKVCDWLVYIWEEIVQKNSNPKEMWHFDTLWKSLLAEVFPQMTHNIWGKTWKEKYAKNGTSVTNFSYFSSKLRYLHMLCCYILLVNLVGISK